MTREVLKGNNCSDIIRSVVQLAHVLGMRVVAEYVEAREQQVVLDTPGCDAFQGYILSPALSGTQCLLYLLKHAQTKRLNISNDAPGSVQVRDEPCFPGFIDDKNSDCIRPLSG